MSGRKSEEQNVSDMLPEYDFTSMPDGVQGKYCKAYREGHTVKIHKSDGETAIHYFTLEEGAVLLASDVREYFRDSESVNRALRCLIPIIADRDKNIPDSKSGP